MSTRWHLPARISLVVARIHCPLLSQFHLVAWLSKSRTYVNWLVSRDARHQPAAGALEFSALGSSFGNLGWQDIIGMAERDDRLPCAASRTRIMRVVLTCTVCFGAGDYFGPQWFDFSAASLTSFAVLEQKVHRLFDAEDAVHAAAAAAAAKYAAALGCTDQEIYALATRAAEISGRSAGWRAGRDGADEPDVWSARLLRDGSLQKLVDAPPAHDSTNLLPWPNEAGCGLTTAHAFALLNKADEKLAKEVDMPQSAIVYAGLFHLAGGARAGLEPR